MSEREASNQAANYIWERIVDGTDPAVRCDAFNLMASADDPDAPSDFILSFAGVDFTDAEKRLATHAVFDETTARKLLGQLVQCLIADDIHAVHGLATWIDLAGNVSFEKPGGSEN